MLDAWIEWLNATALARSMRASVWVYPLVNASHLLGIALLIGAITTFDLRLLGWRREIAIESLSRVLLPVARAGFLLAAASGALLFVTRAPDYVHHPIFQLKLAAVLLALANIVWIYRAQWWREYLARGRPCPRVRLAALVSLFSWLGVLLAGRLIGYR